MQAKYQHVIRIYRDSKLTDLVQLYLQQTFCIIMTITEIPMNHIRIILFQLINKVIFLSLYL